MQDLGEKTKCGLFVEASTRLLPFCIETRLLPQILMLLKFIKKHNEKAEVYQHNCHQQADKKQTTKRILDMQNIWLTI